MWRRTTHGGGFSGIHSNLDMFLGSGYTAVVMFNYGGGAMPIADKTRELIGNRSQAVTETRSATPPASSQA